MTKNTVMPIFKKAFPIFNHDGALVNFKEVNESASYSCAIFCPFTQIFSAL